MVDMNKSKICLVVIGTLMLVIALVVLVTALVIYRGEMKTWVSKLYGQIKNYRRRSIDQRITNVQESSDVSKSGWPKVLEMIDETHAINDRSRDDLKSGLQGLEQRFDNLTNMNGEITDHIEKVSDQFKLIDQEARENNKQDKNLTLPILSNNNI